MVNALLLGQNLLAISWGDRLSSWVNPYHNLETRIQALASKNLLSIQDKKDVQRAVQLAHGWTWPAGRMRTLLEGSLSKHIQELADELLKGGDEKVISKKLQQYLDLLNTAVLLDLSDLKTSDKAASWFHSRGLIKKSLLKNHFEKEGRAILKEFWFESKYYFHHILDILVSLLGINEIALSKHSRWSSDDRMSEFEAVSKLEAYGRLIGYPAIVFGFIYSYIEFKAVAFSLTTAVILLSLVTLVAYERYWKPCPKDHYGLKNLTLEMLRSKEHIYVRQEILRKIERAFKEKKGVLLVGEPGAGKSWIPRSMVEQMREGKSCTFMRDPQVFSCGASRFKTRDSTSLDSIAERFKKYKDQVIFFFDEFHSFFKVDGANGMSQADDIKMFCEDFKYVIGATTTKEYDEFVKKQPAIIDRRFIVVKVGKLEDKKIKTILSQFLQIHHPTISLDVKTIDYIIKKAKDFNANTSKIDAAQTLLNLAVKEIETIEFTTLESKIDQLEAEKNLLEQELLQAQIGKDHDLTIKLEKKQKEIDRSKKQLDQKNRQADRMKKVEAYYLKLKQEGFQVADPAVTLSPDSPLERKWVELQAKIKVIGDFLEKERGRLSLPTRLDKALIDKIIKEKNG